MIANLADDVSEIGLRMGISFTVAGMYIGFSTTFVLRIPFIRFWGVGRRPDPRSVVNLVIYLVASLRV